MLFQCPPKLKAEDLLRYQALHFLSTVLIISAIFSLKLGHELQDLENRVHHATIPPFDLCARFQCLY